MYGIPKGSYPFGGFQRQSLWWGLGQRPNKKLNGVWIMNKNKVKIKICNTSFTVSGEDAVEYTLSVAAEVDRDVRSILTSSARISVTEAAILAALNYCDAYKKSEKSVDALRRRNRDYLDSAAKIRLQSEEYRRENIKLKRENEILRQRLVQSSKTNENIPPLSSPVTSVTQTENTVKIEDEEAAEE